MIARTPVGLLTASLLPPGAELAQEANDIWLSSLMAELPKEGSGPAITMARRGITTTRTDPASMSGLTTCPCHRLEVFLGGS